MIEKGPQTQAHQASIAIPDFATGYYSDEKALSGFVGAFTSQELTPATALASHAPDRVRVFRRSDSASTSGGERPRANFPADQWRGRVRQMCANGVAEACVGRNRSDINATAVHARRPCWGTMTRQLSIDDSCRSEPPARATVSSASQQQLSRSRAESAVGTDSDLAHRRRPGPD
jgi:hypothetical protein